VLLVGELYAVYLLVHEGRIKGSLEELRCFFLVLESGTIWILSIDLRWSIEL
jgi:hypothetical protein